MSFSLPQHLYQGSALLFLLSIIEHLKMGGGIVSSSLKPLGGSKGAAMAKMNWMGEAGYFLACATMIHKFSYTLPEQLTVHDTLFILVVGITNFYGAWSFARLGHWPGVLVLLLRSFLLVAARALSLLES